MDSSKNNIELYVKEPRLQMNGLSRFLIRFACYITYSILVAAAVTFSVADIRWLQATGWFLVLFLVDRLMHARKPEQSLVHLPKKGRVNAAAALTNASLALIEAAMERTLILGGEFALHLIRRLLDRSDIKAALIRMDADPKEMIAKTEEYIQQSVSKRNNLASVSKEVEIFIIAAFQQAVKAQSGFIEPHNLFSALSEIKNEQIEKLYKLFDIDAGDLGSALLFARASAIKGWRAPITVSGFLGRPHRVRHRVMNRSWTARPTPFLDQYAEDITDLARAEGIGFLIGHEVEYDRLRDVLSRPGNPNALLIGEPGIGKETIIEHLAYEITKDRTSAQLFDKRLVKLEIASLVAGAQEGELQERIKKIINEIVAAGNIILYIPDIHNLVKTSGQLHLSGADVLLPAIKSDAFSVIGATYPQEFKRDIEPNNDFTSAFEMIRVQEISETDAARYMVYDSILLERQYKIMISFGAIKQAIQLAHRYFRDKTLPGSAQGLLREALADAVEKGAKVLGQDEVIAVAEKRVNVPLHKAGKAEAEQLLNLEATIHERFIDQEEAVREVAQALREYRAGLTRKGGPIASFLFVGPTGVGKTELSKIIAKIQFGSSNAMIRFDMSEYQEKQSINRFIGSPDGALSGSLTSAVLEKPYSLILLDEFEKAHPDILNLFLQVFDDGRLTDNLGRVVDFQNTIIIATSNAHSEFIKSEIEAKRAVKEIAENLKKKLVQFFKPELLNRFSDIIVFKPLSQGDIEKIAEIQLNGLADQVKEAQGIDVVFEGSAVKGVAKLGFDPVFGARPLRNVISDRIKAVLAEKILKQEIGRGETVKIGYNGEVFWFSK